MKHWRKMCRSVPIPSGLQLMSKIEFFNLTHKLSEPAVRGAAPLKKNKSIDSQLNLTF